MAFSKELAICGDIGCIKSGMCPNLSKDSCAQASGSWGGEGKRESCAFKKKYAHEAVLLRKKRVLG